MFVQKNKTDHKHTFKRAFKKDIGVPGNESYSKGTRYLLMWICTGCPLKDTYDLTHEQPNTRLEKQL